MSTEHLSDKSIVGACCLMFKQSILSQPQGFGLRVNNNSVTMESKPLGLASGLSNNKAQLNKRSISSVSCSIWIGLGTNPFIPARVQACFSSNMTPALIAMIGKLL